MTRFCVFLVHGRRPKTHFLTIFAQIHIFSIIQKNNTNQQKKENINKKKEKNIMENLTIDTLISTIIPKIRNYSSLKLYLYYYQQAQNPNFNNQLDLTKFRTQYKVALDTAYRAINSLKSLNLIPQNTIFINTYEPNKS